MAVSERGILGNKNGSMITWKSAQELLVIHRPADMRAVRYKVSRADSASVCTILAVEH